MTELIGHQLGQYVVTEQIGKGGMSTVYLATQASMRRSVAIKVLPRNLTHDDKFLERFYREVQIAASLQHPHILPVYDFGEYEGVPYIVMAYVNGGTLGDWIAQGAMDPSVVRRVTQEMADALDYAHRKGVIHRDFKPGNVLLDDEGNTYLTDFGLAKMSESSMQITGTGILGTPAYMAPEQAEPKELAPTADVYALGVTIFQMLTGHAPYEAPTPLGVLMAHVTQPIPKIHQLRPELPQSVQVVIERAMAKSPEGRYPSTLALSEALSKALEGEKVSTQELLSEGRSGMLMTNMLGQVIFLDHPSLRILKRHHNEARAIIGKSLAEVLNIPREQAEQIITTIGKAGHLEPLRIEIRDALGGSLAVFCRGVATRDDKGGFVGADITLQPVQDIVVMEPDSGVRPLDTREESFLQTYFVKQMDALRLSLVQWGGKRLGGNLDKIINETAQRNVWPVTMQDGVITSDLKQTDTDIYRALLAKAITYAVGLVGKKVVVKAMQTVDKQLDPRMVEYVSSYRFYDLFDVL